MGNEKESLGELEWEELMLRLRERPRDVLHHNNRKVPSPRFQTKSVVSARFNNSSIVQN